MELREATETDRERIREVVSSAMTASYALSPGQITAVVEDEFGDERLDTLDEEGVVLVAENGAEEVETIGGVVEAELDGDRGEVRWLFVDPEHRGQGIGTRLFEAATEELRDRGAERVDATVLEANTEGEQFFERFGFERIDDQRTEIGGESLVEYLYTEGDAEEAEPDSVAEADPRPEDEEQVEVGDLPDVEDRDGTLVSTTADGQEVYLAREETESGREGPFLVAYTDEDHADKYGYYCSNCGSLDTAMDNMNRIECNNCGNSHASRGGEGYDDSYL